MKKRYTTPDMSLDSFWNSISLLADSSTVSTPSTLEGFIDDGDVIIW